MFASMSVLNWKIPFLEKKSGIFVFGICGKVTFYIKRRSHCLCQNFKLPFLNDLLSACVRRGCKYPQRTHVCWEFPGTERWNFWRPLDWIFPVQGIGCSSKPCIDLINSHPLSILKHSLFVYNKKFLHL